MKIKRFVSAICLSLCFALCSEAKVKLPVLVSDGMVIQREQNVQIWGTADAGEGVVITFQKKKYSTSADTEGNWSVTLPPMKAGGPYSMTVNDMEIKDILVGDVWLCSGQSNMELPIRRVLDLYEEEVKDYANTNIRYVKVPTAQNYHGPQTDIPSVSWATLTPEESMSFSALCYFFAKDLNETIHVPVGIINSSVGGSPIESWISEDGLRNFPHYLHDRDIHRSDAYMENVSRLDGERRTRWNDVLYKEDKGLQGIKKWFDPFWDDTGWAKTDLENNAWAKDGVGLVNGSFWFRKEIELPARLAEKDAILRLGCMVDADSVFVNGVLVGAISYQYPPRIYSIPAHLLKPGGNNVTIRLISYSGLAQFVDDKPYKLIFGEDEIDLRKDWKYKLGVRMPALQGVGSYQQRATGFYNGMIAPLRNFSFKGVLWYQGESNAGRYHEYYDLLSSLINDWRSYWEQPEMPFFVVQLPNFGREATNPTGGQWAEMREIQKKISQTVPNTGLVVAIDAGEWNDIHPLNKKDIGKRLSLQAQRIAYGDKKVVADGPVFESMNREGNRIILSFEEGTNDLQPVAEVKGFAIAGMDNVYKWAKAKIEGNNVVVWNEDISEPVNVRYAWEDNPGDVNLRNRKGIPASPFQTCNENE